MDDHNYNQYTMKYWREYRMARNFRGIKSSLFFTDLVQTSKILSSKSLILSLEFNICVTRRLYTIYGDINLSDSLSFVSFRQKLHAFENCLWLF